MFACYVSAPAPATTPREGSHGSPGLKHFITPEYFNMVIRPNWPSLFVDCWRRQRPVPQSALKPVSHLRALTDNPFNALDEQKDKGMDDKSLGCH